MPLLTEERDIQTGNALKSLLQGRRLILASISPGRREILSELGIDFEIIAPGVAEHINSTPPDLHVLQYSQLKARAIAQSVKEGLILGADTIVVLENKILVKPKDRAEASRMLNSLAGKTHTVYTGVTLINCQTSQESSGYETTLVTFNPLDEKTIDEYLATGEFLDKAGAYGIQGMGSLLVKEIQGNIDNVIGLPLTLVHRLLGEVI